jgi:peptidoglycan/LPS O-acetylase OafA/YrhL
MTTVCFLSTPETAGVEIRRFFYGLAALAALVVIFLYKRRKLQMTASLLLGLLLLLLFAVYFPTVWQDGFSVSRLLLFIPLIAAVFAFTAYRAIKKDDALLRSLNRLR